VIKIRCTTSFGGEEKPSVPCHKILRYDKDPVRYDTDTDRRNSRAFLPASLLGASAATRAGNTGG
jgi:hypothetical protein